MPTPTEIARQAEQLDEEQWFEFLDELDEVTRRRHGRAALPPPLLGKSRDEVAAWVARTHLLTDSGVKEVWYLPSGAPPDEIRLLETNDRLAGPDLPGAGVHAVDFGLDIEGVDLRLLVADLTSEQLVRIKQDPSRLPPGWSLDGSRVWKRQA